MNICQSILIALIIIAFMIIFIFPLFNCSTLTPNNENTEDGFYDDYGPSEGPNIPLGHNFIAGNNNEGVDFLDQCDCTTAFCGGFDPDCPSCASSKQTKDMDYYIEKSPNYSDKTYFEEFSMPEHKMLVNCNNDTLVSLDDYHVPANAEDALVDYYDTDAYNNYGSPRMAYTKELQDLPNYQPCDSALTISTPSLEILPPISLTATNHLIEQDDIYSDINHSEAHLREIALSDELINPFIPRNSYLPYPVPPGIDPY